MGWPQTSVLEAVQAAALGCGHDLEAVVAAGIHSIDGRAAVSAAVTPGRRKGNPGSATSAGRLKRRCNASSWKPQLDAPDRAVLRCAAMARICSGLVPATRSIAASVPQHRSIGCVAVSAEW
jgi:hypothetical protein